MGGINYRRSLAVVALTYNSIAQGSIAHFSDLAPRPRYHSSIKEGSQLAQCFDRGPDDDAGLLCYLEVSQRNVAGIRLL